MNQLERWIASLIAAAGMLLLPMTLAAGDLMIQMKPGPVSAPTRTVTVGDVADVTGGSEFDRARIQQLDLDSLEHEHDRCQITQHNVEIRVLVSGMKRHQFFIRGSESVTVGCSPVKQLKPRLERLLSSEIARQFGLEQQNVLVRLTNDQQVQAVQSRLVTDQFTTFVLLPNELPVGKSAIDVEFDQQNGRRTLERFETLVIVSLELALAKQRIPQGTVVEKAMLNVIKRPLQQMDDFAPIDQIVGKIAKRDITSNQVVLSSFIAAPVVNRGPIVKRNDLLDVKVRIGRNEVRLKNAKAMSQGNVGDTIAVLNTESNKRLNAIIVDRNLAVVPAITGVVR